MTLGLVTLIQNAALLLAMMVVFDLVTRRSRFASHVELAQFNRALVGRELRRIAMKRKINERCRRLGEPPRHASVEEEGEK